MNQLEERALSELLDRVESLQESLGKDFIKLHADEVRALRNLLEKRDDILELVRYKSTLIDQARTSESFSILGKWASRPILYLAALVAGIGAVSEFFGPWLIRLVGKIANALSGAP